MVMADKKPWLIPESPWDTEAKFITWVRGVMRKGWGVHPIKLIYLTSKKHKIKNTNPRSNKAHPEVWAVECEQCHEVVKPSEIEIDHAGDVQGKFTCMDDIQGYAEHLYLVDFDSLEAVCKSCHKVRTLAQKNGTSFEQAVIDKKIIAAMLDKTTIQVDKLQRLGYNDVSNKDKRKACWADYFNKESNEVSKEI